MARIGRIVLGSSREANICSCSCPAPFTTSASVASGRKVTVEYRMMQAVHAAMQVRGDRYPHTAYCFRTNGQM